MSRPTFRIAFASAALSVAAVLAGCAGAIEGTSSSPAPLATIATTDLAGAPVTVDVLAVAPQEDGVDYDLDVDGHRYQLRLTRDTDTLVGVVAEANGDDVLVATFTVDGQAQLISGDGWIVSADALPVEFTDDDVAHFALAALSLFGTEVQASLAALVPGTPLPDGVVLRKMITTAACKAKGCSVVLDLSCNNGFPVACVCKGRSRECAEPGWDIWM